MVSKIHHIYQRFNQLIQHLASKLLVFQQILITIIIMAAFLVFVSYNGFIIINRMQTTALNIFNEGIGGYNALYGVRLALEQYKGDYLQNLHRNSNIQVSADFIGRVSYYLSCLKDVDSIAVNSLEEDLSKLKIIANEPVSEENFINITRVLSSMNTELMTFDTKVQNDAVDTMRTGEKISNQLKGQIIAIIIFGILIAIILSLFIAASVSRPFKDIVNASSSLAKGDLTKDLKTQGCREATEVVRSLNSAINGLRGLVQGINAQSGILSSVSKNLKGASVVSGRSATEVAKAMAELAKASSGQSEQINQMVDAANDLSELVRKVFQDTANIASGSERVAESAQTGQALTVNITNKMDELYGATQEVAEAIEELNRTSAEISTISGVISGLAEQTSLLALNASIEAARAGEHGKGFGVVAKETGKLAEQSKQSAQLISELVGKINSQTGLTVETIQKEIERVETGKAMTNKAASTFEEMFAELRDILDQIKQVASTAQQMAEKNENVIQAITTIAAISQEGSASTEEVLAAAMEQTAASGQVTSLAENMELVANTLHDSVAIFETNTNT
jgi:methyl-accepting chemotaxis protein